MADHKDWIIWQKAMKLVTEVYKITKKFPQFEIHGLASQMQRAAVSIPSNIAEGYRRIGLREKNQFFKIAFGSGGELETQLEIAKRLSYLSEADFIRVNGIMSEVMKILSVMLFKKKS